MVDRYGMARRGSGRVAACTCRDMRTNGRVDDPFGRTGLPRRPVAAARRLPRRGRSAALHPSLRVDGRSGARFGDARYPVAAAPMSGAAFSAGDPLLRQSVGRAQYARQCRALRRPGRRVRPFRRTPLSDAVRCVRDRMRRTLRGSIALYVAQPARRSALCGSLVVARRAAGGRASRIAAAVGTDRLQWSCGGLQSAPKGEFATARSIPGRSTGDGDREGVPAGDRSRATARCSFPAACPSGVGAVCAFFVRGAAGLRGDRGGEMRVRAGSTRVRSLDSTCIPRRGGRS